MDCHIWIFSGMATNCVQGTREDKCTCSVSILMRVLKTCCCKLMQNGVAAQFQCLPFPQAISHTYIRIEGIFISSPASQTLDHELFTLHACIRNGSSQINLLITTPKIVLQTLSVSVSASCNMYQGLQGQRRGGTYKMMRLITRVAPSYISLRIVILETYQFLCFSMIRLSKPLHTTTKLKCAVVSVRNVHQETEYKQLICVGGI